jgi:hypothetical protein
MVLVGIKSEKNTVSSRIQRSKKTFSTFGLSIEKTCNLKHNRGGGECGKIYSKFIFSGLGYGPDHRGRQTETDLADF